MASALNAAHDGAGGKGGGGGLAVAQLKFWRLERDAGSRQSTRSGLGSKAGGSFRNGNGKSVGFAADDANALSVCGSVPTEPLEDVPPAKVLEQQMRASAEQQPTEPPS